MDKTAHFLQLSNETRQRFERTTNELLTHVIREAGPEINSHIVNKGIKASGASCFSYMRADMAMSSDGSAILYEINEFPFSGQQDGVSRTYQERGYRDLFRMIGLDVPPMPASERADYEMNHLGGWVPLYIEG